MLTATAQQKAALDKGAKYGATPSLVCSRETVPTPASVLALEGGSECSRKERVLHESWTDERRTNRRDFTGSGKGRKDADGSLQGKGYQREHLLLVTLA